VSCLFYWDAFGIEKIVGEKINGSIFGRVIVPRMRAPGAGLGLACPGLELGPHSTWGHLAFGLHCLYDGSNSRAHVALRLDYT